MKSILALTFVLILALGCSDKKNQAGEATENDKMNYPGNGYVMATVMHDESASAPCDYLLKSDNLLLEPMELAKPFKKDGLNVWLKYVPQRRQGQCENTVPIGIDDIKKRED